MPVSFTQVSASQFIALLTEVQAMISLTMLPSTSVRPKITPTIDGHTGGK